MSIYLLFTAIITYVIIYSKTKTFNSVSSIEQKVKSRINKNDNNNDESTHLTENYEIIEKIGCGSFGEVHKCKHKLDQEIYAIKCIKNIHKHKDQKGEPNILSQLKHENIIRYIYSYLERDRIYIVLEMADLSLLELMKKNKNAIMNDANSEITWIMNDIGNALTYMHDKAGIVHLDIKPANILIKNKTLKLCDFGQSQFISDIKSKGVNINEGDSRYLAPESLDGYVDQPTKIDIYALGLISTQIVNGNIELSKLKNKKLPELDNKNINKQLINLILNCINYDPKQRPTAADIILKLSKVDVNIIEQYYEKCDDGNKYKCKWQLWNQSGEEIPCDIQKTTKQHMEHHIKGHINLRKNMEMNGKKVIKELENVQNVIKLLQSTGIHTKEIINVCD